MHRVNRLALVELLSRDAGDALALLDEHDRRGCLKAPGHPDDVVHEIPVQAGRGGHEHVVLAADLELIEGPTGSVAGLPPFLLDELEEGVAQSREAGARPRVEGHAPAQLARQVAQLDDLRVRRKRGAQPREGNPTAPTGPGREQLEVRPELEPGLFPGEQASEFLHTRGRTAEPRGDDAPERRRQLARATEGLVFEVGEQLSAVRTEGAEQLQEGGRVGGSHRRDVSLGEGQAQDQEILQGIVFDREDLRWDHVLALRQAGHALIEMAPPWWPDVLGTLETNAGRVPEQQWLEPSGLRRSGCQPARVSVGKTRQRPGVGGGALAGVGAPAIRLPVGRRPLGTVGHRERDGRPFE